MSQDRAAAFHLAAHVLYRGLLPESESTRAELAAAPQPGQRDTSERERSLARPEQRICCSKAPVRAAPTDAAHELPPPQRCLGVSPELRSPGDTEFPEAACKAMPGEGPTQKWGREGLVQLEEITPMWRRGKQRRK